MPGVTLHHSGYEMHQRSKRVNGLAVRILNCGLSAQSTYTGVYARGGPTNVDPSKELSALLDRSEADVRGIKKTSSNASALSDASLTARGTPPSRQASSTGERPANRGQPSPQLSG